MNTVIHPIPPVFDRNSKILILGSFPSVKSREGHFFYHHPQNRFWKTLAGVLDVPVPDTIAEKKAFLLSHRIALWDVIASCSIEGSSDSSIRDVVPNALSRILSAADIQAIFCNGKTSWNYYKKYCAGRKRVLETGYISWLDYQITCMAQLIVAIVPRKSRAWIFKKVLRKNHA